MEKTIKLQGISGQQEGTATKNLKIGDVIVWNFGYKSEVVEIIPSKTGKTIKFMLKSCDDGIIRERKMGAERLVVVEKKKEEEPKNEAEKELFKMGIIEKMRRDGFPYKIKSLSGHEATLCGIQPDLIGYMAVYRYDDGNEWCYSLCNVRRCEIIER